MTKAPIILVVRAYCWGRLSRGHSVKTILGESGDCKTSAEQITSGPPSHFIQYNTKIQYLQARSTSRSGTRYWQGKPVDTGSRIEIESGDAGSRCGRSSPLQHFRTYRRYVRGEFWQSFSSVSSQHCVSRFHMVLPHLSGWNKMRLSRLRWLPQSPHSHGVGKAKASCINHETITHPRFMILLSTPLRHSRVGGGSLGSVKCSGRKGQQLSFLGTISGGRCGVARRLL